MTAFGCNRKAHTTSPELFMSSPLTPQLITDASAWSGPEIQNDPSWTVQINERQQAELLAGLCRLKADGLTLNEVSRRHFLLPPGLQRLAKTIQGAVTSDRGFILVKGFPVAKQTDEDIRLMYLGFCRHLGTCVSQDVNCSIVADVKEKGLGTEKLTRAYGNKHGTRLHVDLADTVGLLGVRQANNGALSTLASSAMIYNEFVKQHPDWLGDTYEGFYWDRYGEHKEWEEAISPRKIPLFSFSEGRLSTRYNRNWITAASVRRNIPFTEREEAILDFFDEMARKHALPMHMQPGDVYFANNYTVLHGREAYQESEDTPSDQKRLFLRIWVNMPNIRPIADESLVRFGLTSHGNIGWTTVELAEGKHLIPHQKRQYLELEEA
jgi:hypothetical protein